MCRGQVGDVSRCSDHDHLLRCGQTVASRYRILKAFQCVFRKKANVSLILKMSPNFKGCRDICPHVLATFAEHCAIKQIEQVQCYVVARFVARHPFNPHQSDSVSFIISSLQRPSLQSRRQRADIILLYRVVHSLVAVRISYLPSPALILSTRQSND